MLESENITPKKRPFGYTRSKHILLADKIKNVFDNSRSCGWHHCNEMYSMRRGKNDQLSDSYRLIITAKGEGQSVIGHTRYELVPNTLLIISPNTPQIYQTSPKKDWDFYWAHLNGPGAEAMLAYIVREYGSFFQITCFKELTEYLELMINTKYRYFEYEILVAQIIPKLLFTLFEDITGPAQDLERSKQLVVSIIDYIETHYNENFTLDSLSKRFFVSVEHIIRVFKSETGMTPHQYIKRYRFEKACYYLEETNMSVSEIARKVGYSSTSTFIGQFHNKYDVTPFLYRTQKHN